jgi:hypothetical protein
MAKGEYYNETELGARDYIRRLEVELAAKNRQIRVLQERLSTLAGTPEDADAKPLGREPHLVQGGYAALPGPGLTSPWLRRHAWRLAAARPVHIAALTSAGAAAAVTAAVVLSAPGQALRAPTRLGAPQAPPGQHLTVRPRRAGAVVVRIPATPAYSVLSAAPMRSPQPAPRRSPRPPPVTSSPAAASTSSPTSTPAPSTTSGNPSPRSPASTSSPSLTSGIMLLWIPVRV